MVIAYDADPIELVVFLAWSVSEEGVPSASSRGRPGWDDWSTGRPAALLPSQRLTRKTRVWLAKLVETIRTNYKGRYDEIHHHWGGNVLGPTSVAQNAKLKKAKVKELATKVG
ncbi:hypothetical protein U0070_005421 [Myodes glareolus]|uniref:60S ribosomal protein L7a n=1 Tax=Myodes glareolus TaxID=447135 RepID=A0AAW0HAI3_MYOGA